MAANDLLTIDEARRAGPGEGIVAHDEDLQIIVTGISTRIDKLCGPVVHREIVDERHDGGDVRIWLDHPPAHAVTSVTEWAGGVATVLDPESDATRPVDGFLLDHTHLMSYVWRRRSGADARFAAGRRNVVVTYTAGRFATTATVDERFKMAAQSIIRRVWKRESEAWAQTPDFFSSVDDPAGQDRFRGFFRAVKPMVDELLADELLPPAAA